jgi:hypothetical protein
MTIGAGFDCGGKAGRVRYPFICVYQGKPK